MSEDEKKESGPAPHDRYLHELGMMTPYFESIRDEIKKVKAKKVDKKVNIDSLIEQITDSVNGPAQKHFGDQNHQVKVEYDELREWFADNEDRIHKKGGLDEDMITELAGLYRNRVSQYAMSNYAQNLKTLKPKDAKESVKKVATFLGQEHHHSHIDRTVHIDTLVGRVSRRYHQDALSKVTEMYRDDKYAKKGGIYDFAGYKPGKQDGQHGGHH